MDETLYVYTFLDNFPAWHNGKVSKNTITPLIFRSFRIHNFIIIVDFCENPEVGIKNPDEIQECKVEMAEFIPEVLQVIFTNLEENRQNTCYDAFEVCDQNPKAIEENGCADCVYTISELFSTLSSNEYSKEQEELLINEICPSDSDPVECSLPNYLVKKKIPK